MARYDEKGREIPDPTPIELPLHFRRPETLQEQIRRLIRTEFSNEAAMSGHETFLEADDFDVDPDEPRSQWELDDDQLNFRGPEASGDPSTRQPVDGRSLLPGGNPQASERPGGGNPPQGGSGGTPEVPRSA